MSDLKLIHFEPDPIGVDLPDAPQQDKFGTEVHATPLYWIGEALKFLIPVALLVWALL